MAFLAYIVASLSFGVLSGVYWHKPNYVAAVVAGVACMFFMARLFFVRRLDSAPSSGPSPKGSRPAARCQVQQELAQMLPGLHRNRNIARNVCATLAILAVAAGAFNLPLGIALCVFALLPGWLFVRNQQAITMITAGLQEAQ